MNAWRAPRPTARWVAAAAACGAFALVGIGRAAAEPSQPGRALLAAAGPAATVVVGRVIEVAALDRTAYIATFAPERVLAGHPPASLRVAWEELGRPGKPRLAAGQRVLVALEPLPGGSLWRQRVPAGDALIVGGRGDAFVVDPSDDEVALLARCLSAAGPARSVPLAELVRGARPPLADAALEHLAKGDLLDLPAARILLAAAGDERRPLPLRRAIVEALGASGIAALATDVEPLARPGSPLEGDALSALGRLNGGLPNNRVEALLDRPEPAARAAGARFATGALAERRLPPLVRSDPDPAVRAAAAAALAGTRTLWGIDGAVPGLADRDPAVRAATAQALAGIGEPAVPILERVARAGGPEARGAITALAHAGPAGAAAVHRLAATGPDEAVRDYARLALGEGPHSH